MSAGETPERQICLRKFSFQNVLQVAFHLNASRPPCQRPAKRHCTVVFQMPGWACRRTSRPLLSRAKGRGSWEPPAIARHACACPQATGASPLTRLRPIAPRRGAARPPWGAARDATRGTGRGWPCEGGNACSPAKDGRPPRLQPARVPHAPERRVRDITQAHVLEHAALHVLHRDGGGGHVPERPHAGRQVAQGRCNGEDVPGQRCVGQGEDRLGERRHGQVVCCPWHELESPGGCWVQSCVRTWPPPALGRQVLVRGVAVRREDGRPRRAVAPLRRRTGASLSRGRTWCTHAQPEPRAVRSPLSPCTPRSRPGRLCRAHPPGLGSCPA